MNLMTHEAEEAIAKAKGKPRGRKDNEGQEAVVTTKPIRERIAELCTLKEKSEQAKEALNAAIKATAEAAGMQSSVVRKFVNARSGDKFDQEARKVEQLGIVFSEVGEK